MSENDLSRGQKLYAEACQVVAEEVKLGRKSGRNIVRLASILRDIYDVFQTREDPRESIVLIPKRKGFTDFRECMLELLRPLELGERAGFYYLSIGRHLLGKIPESELAEMGFAKVKELARVAKANRDLPAELIEMAKDPEEPAVKLREQVDVMLYRGASDHSEGPKRSLLLVGGKDVVDAIEEKIKRLRPAVTEEGASAPATDAQVVDFALADCLAGVQEAEDHNLKVLRGGRP